MSGISIADSVGAALKELKSFAKEHPRDTALYVLLMIFFAGADIIEIVPQAGVLTHNPVFPFVHESHDIIAVIAALYITYKRGVGIGALTLGVFYAIHLPYFWVQFANEPYEVVKITVAFVAGLFGVTIIGRLREALKLAGMREHEARNAQLDRREADSRYRGILGAMSEVILLVDVSGACVEMPTTRPRLPVREHFSKWVGRKLGEVLDEAQVAELKSATIEALDRGRAVAGYFAVIDAKPICFDIIMSPAGDGLVIWVMREGDPRNRSRDTEATAVEEGVADSNPC